MSASRDAYLDGKPTLTYGEFMAFLKKAVDDGHVLESTPIYVETYSRRSLVKDPDDDQFIIGDNPLSMENLYMVACPIGASSDYIALMVVKGKQSKRG